MKVIVLLLTLINLINAQTFADSNSTSTKFNQTENNIISQTETNSENEQKKDKNFIANFKELRGNGYGLIHNPSLSLNMNDLTTLPSQIGNRKLVYIEPSSERGIAYIPLSNNTMFIDFTNNGNIGLTRVGFANNDKSFGIGLNLGLGININSIYNDSASYTTDSIHLGNTISVNASFDVSNSTIYTQLGYLTLAPATRATTKLNDKIVNEIDNDNYSIWLNFGLTNKINQDENLKYDASIYMGRQNYSTTYTMNTFGDTTYTIYSPSSNYWFKFRMCG